MFQKSLIFIWIFGIVILGYWLFNNHGLALGFDHGRYKQFVDLYGLYDGDMGALPEGYRSQFEPFSGTFFYTLTEFLGSKNLYVLAYFSIYILTATCLLFLGKKGNHYTFGSILGFTLFFFSSIQFVNFSGSLGKQLFATLLLVIIIRHFQKLKMSIPLFIACVSLHRLTGFIAIVYIGCMGIFYKRYHKLLLPYLIGMGLAAFTYSSTFHVQVEPFIKSLFLNLRGNILIMHRYGAGFPYKELFYYLLPILFIFGTGLIRLGGSSTKKKYLNHPIFLTLYILAFIVFFRGIAYNRFGSFLELFLIIAITKLLSQFVHKKIIIGLLIIQFILWFLIAKDNHKPFISFQEHKEIQGLMSHIPKDVKIITLSNGYRNIMSGYEETNIQDGYNILLKNVRWEERALLTRNGIFLCSSLKNISGEVFLFEGSKNIHKSVKNNNCLSLVKSWDSGAKLFQFKKNIVQNTNS